jgi:RimJ/RimL family protein N-acetyltransferase
MERYGVTALVPGRIRTDRLLLRSWAAEDAPALLPLLEANRAHLGPWIPPHVAAPVPLEALAARLEGFAGDFAAGRSFRFALLTRKGGQLLGEADLFPRNATGRVPLADADCVELGYWLDAAVTGHGYATEATRALLDLAATELGIGHAEVRCEMTNAASAAVPRRLGLVLSGVVTDDAVVPGAPRVTLQIWTCALATR